ncbi:hypothetical protein [Pelagicoccus sp. SDUM812002]|uniref:hypothetical protein n=1 Tax=Pelagicoccus sp. SDUM812002 TaxID=3041266 RepID=UPI00280CC68C|nr:hypothetical protein [Pelagicoccus sp. SDUM812002]MDQ8184251.1 hypothetical protein [Pelagicoccus sp. SDUM812002]
MKDKIIARLKQIGRGYELDKLPPVLLKAVIDSSIPLIEAELKKAEDRAIQKMITERFVARVIKTALEGNSSRRNQKREAAVAILQKTKPIP